MLFYASFNIVGQADPNPPSPLQHDVIYGWPLIMPSECISGYLILFINISFFNIVAPRTSALGDRPAVTCRAAIAPK